jgi:hypothetical protein
MAIVQGRTRAQLRQSVGYNLGAIRTGTAYDAGSTTTLISLSLVGADDNYNGMWIVVDDASSTTAETRIISDYTASAYRLTLQQALSFATAAGDTFELWESIYRPDAINEFMNQAIMDATGAFYDPVEKLDLHTDGATQRFDVPSGLSMVQNIFYRSKVSSTRLHACGTTFDEVTTPTGFTLSLDTKDRKQGSQSLKISLAAGASAGAFIADSITATDISAYDTVEMWVKVTGISSALAAGNLKLHLDDGTVTADGNDKESLNIPAVSPDTWTFVRMTLANPESDTAIASIGLEHDADLGADVTIWIDDISVVKNDTAQWNQIPRHLWKPDREASDIVLDSEVHGVARYNLLKIVGGDKPALMTADSDTSEVDESYIIAKATALAFAAASGGPQTDPDNKNNMAGFWMAQASRAQRAFPILTNIRQVA